MTPEHLKQWRHTLGLSQTAAARELGVSLAMYKWYEKGEREGRAVVIPKTVALACAAVLNSHPPYGG